ncbi:aspartate/glutamate racemase family protein [Mesorhizobium sp. M0222]|uniref:maleate cis-trans isomerase family protein n=1 Tax=Mesorhizobium sp. M0222 TaxID=2956921 RepID=UPI00333A1E10
MAGEYTSDKSEDADQNIEVRHVTPDFGKIWKVRIGMVDLASGLTGEEEMHRILPEDVLLLTTRVLNSDVISLSTLSAMQDDLARSVGTITPEEPLDVVIYCCTSGTIAIGESKLQSLIHSVRPSVACTNPFSAATAALRHIGASRIALLAPYTLEVTSYMRQAFRAKGFEIPYATTFGLERDAEICQVSHADILASARAQRRDDADALFISCTGLRVVGLIEQIEQELKIPVITSNQAMAWHALRLAGYDQNLPGYGMLGMKVV